MGLLCLFSSGCREGPQGLASAAGAASVGPWFGRSFQDLPDGARLALNQASPDLVDHLRVLDALYIPTRCHDSFWEGAPTDHFGCLQSRDALAYARTLIDAIGSALA